MKQAQLLERYIETLQKDPDALPPLELDAETAHFARTLVMIRQRDLPDGSVKDRVWNQIMFTMHFASEDESIPEFIFDVPALELQDERSAIAPLPFLQRSTRGQGILVTAAAAIFVVVLFSAVLIYSILPGLANLRAEPSQVYVTIPRNVEIDPGDSLLYRTVSMFHEPTETGESYHSMSLRLSIAN